MVQCPACGESNPARFRLCGLCGTPLAPAAGAAHEVRKTVTVVFTDLKGSTALGERLDAESLHEVKKRYFAAMAAEIRRHGGKIEKYIGDAIMAVFGLPRAHEDDALRAVRAADAMRSALADLNAALKRTHGVELASRTGVNTGEVVANIDPTADQELASGDAVNVAARLEQAAAANEVLIGELTHRLVCDAVTAEPAPPIEAKGKSERVLAWRLVGVQGADGNVRRVDTPVVGRDTELAMLEAAYRDAVAHTCARMVTVVGDAGAGKSRLVAELTQRLGERAQVVRGRCLPYGDGITFWPLVTMLRETAAIRDDDSPGAARDKVLALVRDPEVADRLAAAIGLSNAGFALPELVWAARKFLEGLAARGPLVAVIEDIHWAETAFLDLLEHVLDASGGVPLLLLATARHELLDAHPQWGGRPGSTRLMLSPLPADASVQIIANLIGDAGLPDDVVERIVHAADGNPLYVEQLLSMLIDGGTLTLQGGRWRRGDPHVPVPVPPTIHALLEARLDTLSADERATVEPAAVIGVEFAGPAIVALTRAPDATVIDERLRALARKRVVQPWSERRLDPAYRFYHHMVRETVYHAMLKRARANLHIEFVRWADRIDAERDRALQNQEVLGFHLEQAHRYLSELGPLDDAGLAVGADAARRLGEAGRRAHARGDMHAAVGLLQRAARLAPPLDRERLALMPLLAEALMDTGDFAGARKVIDEGIEAAGQVGDAVLQAWLRLTASFVQLHSGQQDNWADDALRTAQAALPLLQDAGVLEVLAIAWRLIALVHGVAGRYGLAGEATRNYVQAARAAGNERLMARSAAGLAMNVLFGPTPATDAIAQCEAALGAGVVDRIGESTVSCAIAQLKAMRGEFDAARAGLRDARARLRELGQGVIAAATAIDLARVELLAGDLAGAERDVRVDHAFLAAKGETYFLPTVGALLARLVRDQGRDAEALSLLDAAERVAATDDHDAQALCRLVRAPIIARTGDLAQAESLARAAIELAGRTEAPILQADARHELAQVLALAGRRDEALASALQARALYADKGDVVSSARIDAWADALTQGSRPPCAETG